MNILKGNKGLTLIEIIISLALIGIIAVAFISMFTAGYKSILAAGGHSRVGYKGQQVEENYLADNTDDITHDPNVDIETIDDKQLTIVFKNGVSISVTGKEINSVYDSGKYNIDISTFIVP